MHLKTLILFCVLASTCLGQQGLESIFDKIAQDLGACSCRQILVSSLGPAQNNQQKSMGVFKYNGVFNNYPSYQSSKTYQWLYYQPTSGWLIGASLGNPTGFVHNGDHNPCPYNIPKDWMYVQNGQWYIDNTLVVRCIA